MRQKLVNSLCSSIGLTIIMIALVLPVSAQDEHISQQIAAIPRTSSDEVMQRPVKLMDGAGKMHQKVTTNSAIAQAYYDQGIAYLHSYVWVEAARSFHEALRHDPRLAMAHLGLAKAYIGATAYKDALTHLQKATEIVNQGNVTEKETRWIALGQQQLDGILSVSGDHNDRLQAYRQAIEELIALDPDDSHAWVLRGNAEERRISGADREVGWALWPTMMPLLSVIPVISEHIIILYIPTKG